MDFIKQYTGLPRQIYILLIARIVSNMGFFIFPFLTLFLKTRIGMAETIIGKFLLICALSFVPAAMIGGKIADKYGRKPVYVTAMLIGNVLFFCCGFLGNTIWVVYLLVVALFFTNMSMPANTAMFMDVTDHKNRQEAFSLLYLGTNIGVAIGPLIAGMLFESFTPWIFRGQAIAGLLSALIIVIFIKEVRPQKDHQFLESKGEEKAASGKMFKLLAERPTLIVFAALSSTLAFIYAQVAFALPLQMYSLFGSAYGARYFGYIMAANGFFVVILSPLILAATKRNPPVLNMALAALCYLVGFGVNSLIHSLWLFLLAVAIWTSGEVLAATNTSVYIASRSPVTHRARFQSIFDIIRGIGTAFGPMIMGYYIISHPIHTVWFVVAAVALSTALLMLLLYGYERKSLHTS